MHYGFCTSCNQACSTIIRWPLPSLTGVCYHRSDVVSRPTFDCHRQIDCYFLRSSSRSSVPLLAEHRVRTLPETCQRAEECPTEHSFPLRHRKHSSVTITNKQEGHSRQHIPPKMAKKSPACLFGCGWDEGYNPGHSHKLLPSSRPQIYLLREFQQNLSITRQQALNTQFTYLL